MVSKKIYFLKLKVERGKHSLDYLAYACRLIASTMLSVLHLTLSVSLLATA